MFGKFIRIAGLALACFLAVQAAENEIGFNERFALASDRTKVLTELIPGTAEYFFYQCLQAQNTGQIDKVGPWLIQWSKQLGEGEQFQIIERRQALLRYSRDAASTLAFLRHKLGLTFNHQREIADPVTSYPAALDPANIAFDRFKQRACASRSDLGGFEDVGLERMVGQPLEKDERRDLLERLPRPDVMGLENLVLTELADTESRGFGRFSIHKKLTCAQLDVLRAGLPDLAGNTAFVDTYARRLLPSSDTDWHADPAVRGAYLARLWSFARTLPTSQNSFKACVLYRLLEHKRTLGDYDAALFTVYLQLPRALPYVRRQWLERTGMRGEQAVNLAQDFRPVTGLASIGNDEPLVRDYLEHLLVNAVDASAFREWLDEDYLKVVFAETKILFGVGDIAVWSSKLDPSQLQALKERVEIIFSPGNPEFVALDGEVALAAALKNISRLTVKVFDIDAAAYYREHRTEVDAGIELDGLVANQERTFDYKDVPPSRRHVERFTFPELKQSGLYVVEWVGNGVSSRALIRKGRLRFMQRPGAAGQVFTVFDDAGRKLDGATLWMAGQYYRADADGSITVPFSTRDAGTQPVIVQQGRLSCLASFSHEAEHYELRLGALLDRESLLAGEKAGVVLRPLLLANGRPADLSLLQQTALEIRTTDVEGIGSTQRREGLVFKDGEDFVHMFKVPARTVAVQVRLTAKIRNVSQNRDDELAAESRLDANGILAGDRVADLFLRRVAGGYVIEARGRNGETLAGRPVNVSFKHRLFREQLQETMQTDAAGRIQLGVLPDISVIQANGVNAAHTWRLTAQEGVALPSALHVVAGDKVVLPAVDLDQEHLRDDLSLLGLTPNGGMEFTVDLFKNVRLVDGLLEIEGLVPGDYRLTFKRTDTAITLRVADAVLVGTTLVGDTRLLEATASRPLQVTGVSVAGDALVIRLAYAAAQTRVHVVARRMAAGGDLWEAYMPGLSIRDPARLTWLAQPAAYVSGRSIGDEARYVLERRYAEHFPGNMLERPSLLLNPWSCLATETVLQQAQAGEQWDAPPSARVMQRGGYGSGDRRRGGAYGAVDAEGNTSTLDFLPAPARVWANLKPDAAGQVRIPLAELAGRGEILAIAADGFSLAWRGTSIAETVWQPRDLRLTKALDPQQPVAECKTATSVVAGKSFTVADLPSARLETFDTLAKVFRFLQTLQPDDTFLKFAFLADWPSLKPERQRELYSEYACHELNFFLYHKDRPFFDKVVKSYLVNKRDQTFMDHWLLGADLSRYLAAGEFSRLNTLERILLGRRIAAQQVLVARTVIDQHNLIPPDPEAFDRRFRTAVQSAELEGANRSEEIKKNMQAVQSVNDRQKDIAGASEPFAPAMAAAPALSGVMQPGQSKRLGADRADKGDLAKNKNETVGEREALHRLSAVDIVKSPILANASAMDEVDAAEMKSDLSRRKNMRQLYRAPEQTREWVETHYYHVPITEMCAGLITVNGFWRDYATHDGKSPFLSPHLDEVAGTLAERLCALAVLDLPFKAAEAKDAVDGSRWTYTPGSHAVIYHQQISGADAGAGDAPLMVVENLFDQADRWRQVGAERVEKYVRTEFVAGRVYGAQVVLTNPTGARRKVSVLLQIPAGALPVSKGLPTRSLPLRLDPYSTQTVEYFFYFPTAGEFAHFPVTVAEDSRIAGRAEARACHVVSKPTLVDKTSWAYISQNGTPEDVLVFLREQNVHSPEIQLSRIAWRMRDAAFFKQTLAELDARHVFDGTLWSYAINHNEASRIREYLIRAQPDFVCACGLWLASPLLDVDAEVLRVLEHKEYWPMVNARAHPLGRQRTIPNTAFFAQYSRLMDYLAYRPELGARERLAVVTGLLLQDRVGEALIWFATVKPGDAETRMQADYLRAYLAFSQSKPDDARKIAAAYVDYPVDRWRNRFRNVVAQVDEAHGAGTKVLDADKREQVQDQLAAEAPSLTVRVEGTKLELRSRNVAVCEVRYFPLDIELLFSRQPFLGDGSARLGYVRPAHMDSVKLGLGEVVRGVDIPADFRQRNVLVEIQAEGLLERISYTPHAMDAQVVANYGQVRVRATDNGRPVAGAYVKVYARFTDGSVRFFKDGYTDLRGAFDYASLSTDDLDRTERFALLVLDQKLGALILEATPPKR